MALKPEATSNVHIAFEDARRAVGYLAPSLVALSLARNSDPRYQTIRRQIYRYPTEPYLFTNSKKTIFHLLTAGDHIAIWTDDYLHRIATSGLGKLRRNLKPQARRNLFASTGQDKIALLDRLYRKAEEVGAKSIVVVDDNKNNLATAKKLLGGKGIDIHMVQASRRIRISLGKFHTISSIEQLIKIRSRIMPKEGNIFWIIDFNNTLLSTKSYEQGIKQTVAEIVS